MEEALLKMLMGHLSPHMMNFDEATPEQLYASMFGGSGASGGYPWGFMGNATGDLQSQSPQMPQMMQPDLSGPQSLLKMLGLTN